MASDTRSKARAAERRKQALLLRIGGATYEQIAAQVGYANKGGAHRAVVQELRDIPKDAADELRTIELTRYDEIQVALTRRLRTGDLTVVPMLIRLSDQRARLTGLYQADTSTEHIDVRVALADFLHDARTDDLATDTPGPADPGQAA